MKNIYIIKPDGSKRKFSFKKVIHSVRRAGASKQLAEQVAKDVLRQIPDEITSQELYNTIYSILRSKNKPTAQVYSLRPALSKIKPDIWEKYVAKIWQYYGYETEWNVIIPGASVEHQVDVIAKKGNETWLIECKHHYDYHRDTGLGEILQVQARLEDVQDGFIKKNNKYDFTGAWLVTNTKFSDHATRYARAKQIKLTGWRFPQEYSLERLIQDRGLYPITVLNVSKKIANTLQYNGILTVKDINDKQDKVKRLIGNDYKRLLKQVEKLSNYNF